jgi:hypothetical protein
MTSVTYDMLKSLCKVTFDMYQGALASFLNVSDWNVWRIFVLEGQVPAIFILNKHQLYQLRRPQSSSELVTKMFFYLPENKIWFPSQFPFTDCAISGPDS